MFPYFLDNDMKLSASLYAYIPTVSVPTPDKVVNHCWYRWVALTFTMPQCLLKWMETTYQLKNY